MDEIVQAYQLTNKALDELIQLQEQLRQQEQRWRDKGTQEGEHVTN